MRPFEVLCMLHGANLAEIEEFITRLETEGAPAGQELRERLNKASEAVSPLNSDVFKRHIEWILVRKAQIEMAEVASPHAKRGSKVHEGAKKGHAAVHGTQEEKLEGWKKLQIELETVHAEHPRWGITDIRKEAANRCGVSSKTVERHTKKTW